MTAVDAVKRTILLINKFGLYLFIPAFLIIAYSYTSATYPQYRVTAKIALKDISTVSAINDIQSKYLVQKALNQLPFQASYYDAETPKNEIFGNSLELKLVFDHQHYAGRETWVRLETASANVISLTDEDTTSYYKFDKPINESYGKFKVVHGAGNKYMQASYIVRVEDQAKLLDQYYNSLRFKTDDNDNTIKVSVLAGNPQKGADFINKLLQLYRDDHHAVSRYVKVGSDGAVVSNGGLIVLEQPENNVEPASISTFWIYTLALLAGLLIPVSRKVIGKFIGYTFPAYVFNLPKLFERINHGVAVKQLD